MTTVRVHFDGKVFVPEEPVELPVGKVVEIQIPTGDPDPPGSPQAILKASRQPPQLSREDVDELERAIASGRLPIRMTGEFDE